MSTKKAQRRVWHGRCRACGDEWREGSAPAICPECHSRDVETIATKQHLYIGAPNPEGWGPWVGVPTDRQHVCAVEGCIVEGRPQVCIADGAYHHHGCVHYDHLPNTAGLTFREGGWCWLCDGHYRQLEEANPGRTNRRRP